MDGIYVKKFGWCLDSNGDSFLLGTNLNINIKAKTFYLCLYLGFKTLVIGRDYFI